MVGFLANHINCFFGVSQSVVLWGFPNIFGSASAGDSQSIWNINSLRGKSVKHYTLATGFACAKVIIPGMDIITQ